MQKLKSLRILLFLGMVLCFSAATSHKFYVSTTQIDYKASENVLQVTIQLFIDDLELALKKETADLRLAPDSDPLIVEDLVEGYLTNHLIFQMDDQLLKLNYLGKEYKNDIAVCYVEVPLEKTTTFTVENRFFLALYEEQKNIIHFKNERQRKSYLLDKKKPTIAIEFER